MWQITLYELNEDKVKPKKAYNSPSGTFHYSCGICEEPVGIHSGNCRHITDGWLYKRDCCKNGHAVDWSGICVETKNDRRNEKTQAGA